MKILFVIRSTVYFMNARSIIEACLSRGHSLRVLFGKSEEAWTEGEYRAPLDAFHAAHPEVEYGDAYYQRTDHWWRILMPVRLLLSYRRYLTVHGQSTYFRDRLVKTLPAPLRPFFRIPVLRSITRWVLRRRAMGRFLCFIDDRAPLDPRMLAQLREERPDVVLLTVGGRRYGSFDVDYLKAARALGIKTAVLVLTWDSVSSKALLTTHPDLLLAWNEIHVREAFEHHNVPNEKTRIIGAPVFDIWFSHLTPSVSREAFSARHGLDPKKPILVYLGSPASITHDERALIRSVRETLDRTHPEVQLVFRPHPAHSARYADFMVPGVHRIPRSGELPDTAASLALFYDTLHYSIGAVGVNTSAMIEAVIAGKPVIALLRSEYAKTQSEAIHFQHLRDRGVLELAETLEAFAAITGALVRGSVGHRAEREAFVRELIRPQGIMKSGGDAAAEALEALVGLEKRP